MKHCLLSDTSGIIPPRLQSIERRRRPLGFTTTEGSIHLSNRLEGALQSGQAYIQVLGPEFANNSNVVFPLVSMSLRMKQ